MAQKNIRVGIIGCGGVARAHVQGYRENKLIPIAFFDPLPDAAERLVQECGQGEVFTDYRALIESGKVDAISICSPPAYHEEAAICALDNGVHVLCEKPLAHTVESGYDIVKAANRSSALTMMAYRHRFLPAITKMREWLKEHRIGKVVLFQNAFCAPAHHLQKSWFVQKQISGGGSILDAGSHSVDLFRFLVGEISQQQALMHRHFEKTDVEDIAVLSVKGSEGAIGTLISSWVTGALIFSIDIIGTQGRIHYDYKKGTELWLMVHNGEEQQVTLPPSNGFKEEIAHFLAAIRGETPLSCKVEDGIRALEVIQSCYSRDE